MVVMFYRDCICTYFNLYLILIRRIISLLQGWVNVEIKYVEQINVEQTRYVPRFHIFEG